MGAGFAEYHLFPVNSGSDVYRVAGFGSGGGSGDGCQRSLPGTGVAVIAGGRDENFLSGTLQKH